MSINERTSGILLPLFSLAGYGSVGALGGAARTFVDFLSRAGQTWWQMLPINPIDVFHSPYSGVSAFAGESLFLDVDELGLPETLVKEVALGVLPGNRVDYESAQRGRKLLYREAFERFTSGCGYALFHEQEEEFYERNRYWLDDYALFQACADRFGTRNWSQWPKEYRRHEMAVRQVRQGQEERDVQFIRFLQLVFDVQWRQFRQYCQEKNILLLGDVPIYVGQASADTWSHPELFQMNEDGVPDRVAGVPADDFNPDGQRWDSPLYDWQEHARTGFDWWLKRIEHTLSRFDAVRLDHFIGFYNYYSFPAGTILGGQGHSGDSSDWLPGPRETFLDLLFDRFDRSRFIAEDLGVMNEGVHKLRDRYDLPGMNVLQFSFDNCGRTNPTLQWKENSIVCTGTHDTPPVLAWLNDLELAGPEHWTPANFAAIWHVLLQYQRDSEQVLMNFQEYPQRYGSTRDYWHYSAPLAPGEHRPVREDLLALRQAVIRIVMNSPGKVALFPMQDLLGLDASARTNFPGRCDGNWLWRLLPGQLTDERADELLALTAEGNRLPVISRSTR
ncbi:MAG: 4-alpha-glucanotransferase [Planctomycetia bacterium]|nr:4-alpha-glucanotransferase [Planctomycetia bacterium]